MLSNTSINTSSDWRYEFGSFISEYFPDYKEPELINPGIFFRFGKNQSAWGILFEDCSGGIIGDWRTNERFVWQSKRSKKTPYEREQFAIHFSKAKALEDAKRELAYLEVAKRCEELFDAAPAAPHDHPYLIKKKVKSYGLRVSNNGSLLIPVHSVTGDMQSIQTIMPNGNKRFYPGAKVFGGCFMIGVINKNKPVLICEGYATGASLLEDGNPFVVIAFNSGNLINVATQLHEKLPDIEIIIAGDDDWKTSGNPGKIAAIEAAKAVGAKVLFPRFGEERDPSWTDFNDLITNYKRLA
jgi:putative DNA primase/helicase